MIEILNGDAVVARHHFATDGGAVGRIGLAGVREVGTFDCVSQTINRIGFFEVAMQGDVHYSMVGKAWNRLVDMYAAETHGRVTEPHPFGIQFEVAPSPETRFWPVETVDNLVVPSIIPVLSRIATMASAPQNVGKRDAESRAIRKVISEKFRGRAPVIGPAHVEIWRAITNALPGLDRMI